MSYSPGAYVPPAPPARRGTSPWVFVGLGCLALAVLFIGAIGVAGYKMAQMMSQPLSKTEVLASLGKVPTHPKALYDDKFSKVAHATAVGLKFALGGKEIAGAGFRIPLKPQEILDWYDKQMVHLGYKVTRMRTNSMSAANGQVQHTYQAPGEIVLVQAQRSPDGDDNSMVLVIRIQGVTKPMPEEAPAQ